MLSPTLGSFPYTSPCVSAVTIETITNTNQIPEFNAAVYPEYPHCLQGQRQTTR